MNPSHHAWSTHGVLVCWQDIGTSTDAPINSLFDPSMFDEGWIINDALHACGIDHPLEGFPITLLGRLICYKGKA